MTLAEWVIIAVVVAILIGAGCLYLRWNRQL